MKSAEILRIHTVMADGVQVIAAADVGFVDGKVITRAVILTSWPSEEQARLAASAIALAVCAEETVEKLAECADKSERDCPLRQSGKKGVLQ